MGLWLRGKSIQRLLYLQGCPFIIFFYKNYDTFTFMHLADAFIQSDKLLFRLYIILSVMTKVPWELNPQPFLRF